MVKIYNIYKYAIIDGKSFHGRGKNLKLCMLTDVN